MHRLAHGSSHVFDFAANSRYRVQSHAGTATLDAALHVRYLYAGDHSSQTCSPGSRRVLGFYVRREGHLTIVEIKWLSHLTDTRKGHKKGHESVPFGSTMVSLKFMQLSWKEW